MTSQISFGVCTALAMIMVPLSGCSPTSNGTTQDASSDTAASDSGGGNDGSSTLTWYMTCGDPVCQAPIDGAVSDAGLTDDAGAPCPAVGSSCSASGQTCGTRNPYVDCGAIEVCAAHDPKLGVGGCPISSRTVKDDIEYVDPAQLDRLHDETIRIRLATYRYKAPYSDPNPKHLGFIIEDDPQSPAVDLERGRVDLYGYLSMVVATTQVQAKEIAELRRELRLLQAGTCPPETSAERP